MKRIFIGKVKSDKGGVEQLKNGYLTGNDSWFGELKKGDYCFISEDGDVKGIRKVINIEEYFDEEFQEKRKKYFFCDVKVFNAAIKSNVILSNKYFKINLVTMVKGSTQTTPNFLE